MYRSVCTYVCRQFIPRSNQELSYLIFDITSHNRLKSASALLLPPLHVTSPHFTTSTPSTASRCTRLIDLPRSVYACNHKQRHSRVCVAVFLGNDGIGVSYIHMSPHCSFHHPFLHISLYLSLSFYSLLFSFLSMSRSSLNLPPHLPPHLHSIVPTQELHVPA